MNHSSILYLAYIFALASLQLQAAEMRERLDAVPVDFLQDVKVQSGLTQLFTREERFAEHRSFSIEKVTNDRGHYYLLQVTAHYQPSWDNPTQTTYYFTVSPLELGYEVSEVKVRGL